MSQPAVWRTRSAASVWDYPFREPLGPDFNQFAKLIGKRLDDDAQACLRCIMCPMPALV